MRCQINRLTQAKLVHRTTQAKPRLPQTDRTQTCQLNTRKQQLQESAKVRHPHSTRHCPNPKPHLNTQASLLGGGKEPIFFRLLLPPPLLLSSVAAATAAGANAAGAEAADAAAAARGQNRCGTGVRCVLRH